jgi:formylglycine-generating enzyme required for sulfatase activity
LPTLLSSTLPTALVLSTALGCAATVSGRSIGREPPGPETVAGIEVVLVQGGCFEMGADEDDCDATPEERPRHEVCLSAFGIGKYEVTRRQWVAVMGSNPSPSGTCARDDCPVDDVAWSDVQEFIARLNATTDGARWRLPTEAEWEYAARSRGKRELYAGGRRIDDLAWYRENSAGANHPVGGKTPNGLGLFDMSGNVWEMTSDRFDAEYYRRSPRDNPQGPSTGADHTLRGGGRADGRPHQRTTRRTSIGNRTLGAGRGGDVGFRLVLAPWR